MAVRIAVASVFVDDQAKAERFYVDVLGFEKRHDIPLGDARWLTVVTAGSGEGAVELLLEPNGHPVAQAYQRGLRESGIPATTFETDDVDAEAARLEQAGVRFSQGPTDAGMVRMAVFDDTCGNLIGLHQVVAPVEADGPAEQP